MNITTFPRKKLKLSKSTTLLITVLVVIGVLTSGCKEVSEFPLGSFETVHEGEIWVMDFNTNGSWNAHYGGELFTSGTYSISGERITWDTDSYCDQGGVPSVATYRWKIRNDSLTFKLEGEELCLSRKIILEDETYQRIR